MSRFVFWRSVRPILLTGVVLFCLPMGGCGASDPYHVVPGHVSDRFLPAERTVRHHPDSLQALEIREGKRRYQFELEEDYESLIRKWSSTYRKSSGGRASMRTQTYATLQSLELALASLEAEMAVSSLRKEKAREFIERRRFKYRQAISIEVHWAESRSPLTGPGTQVRLRIGENEYEPIAEDHSPLRQTSRHDGAYLYRTNTFVFPRTVDGRDLLKDASAIELWFGWSHFTWSWGDDPSEG